MANNKVVYEREELMNIKEISKEIGLTRMTVHNDINSGLITPIKKTGRESLFLKEDVKKYKIKKGKEVRALTTISIVNHKGGVGKSTMGIHLAYFLAEQGEKVLFLDNDPQGNSSNFLLFGEERTNRMSQVYLEEKIERYMIDKTPHRNIDVISANTNLEEKYNDINNKKYAEDTLQRAFENSLEKLNNYDFILIDNHPDLKQLTFNSMVVANGVIVVAEARPFSVDSVEAIEDNLNYSGAKLLGILLNMYRTISNKSKDAENFYRDRFGDKVYKTVVPYWDGLSLGEIENGDFARNEVPYLDGKKKIKEIINKFGKETLKRCKTRL